MMGGAKVVRVDGLLSSVGGEREDRLTKREGNAGDEGDEE